MEITESEQQRESGSKPCLKNEQSLRNFSNFNKRSNICHPCLGRRRETDWAKEMMAGNSPNLARKNLQLEKLNESQR